MDYQELVGKFFERHRSVQSAGFSADAYKPGLEAMQEYAGFLGNPQQQFRCIHVAGTNGKGSVCSMLAAALSASGCRTGLYTSPHLLDFRERIKILPAAGDAPLTGNRGRPWPREREGPSHWAGRDERSEVLPSRVHPLRPEAFMISEEAVCEFVEKYDRSGLTFFEVTTGMALWWFAEQKVDVAVIETGLGGRLDSTNIITPEISIVTSIGLDHCDLLGGTRAEIAAEKAGIFKPGVPALLWGRDEETQPVFERIAAEKGAPLYFAEDYPLPDEFPPLDLEGPCQDVNLRTVLAALSILSESRGITPAMRDAIASAAAITGFHGRWEIVRRNPLVICDIAHNSPALAHNFARLQSLREGQCPAAIAVSCGTGLPSAPVAARGHVNGRGPAVRLGGMSGAKVSEGSPVPQDTAPLLIVFGLMADKDIDGILPLMPRDAEYILVQPATPRAMKLNDLALKLKSLHCGLQPSVAAGVHEALRRAEELQNPIIYIGGSTYVVSEAISYLQSI